MGGALAVANKPQQLGFLCSLAGVPCAGSTNRRQTGAVRVEEADRGWLGAEPAYPAKATLLDAAGQQMAVLTMHSSLGADCSFRLWL